MSRLILLVSLMIQMLIPSVATAHPSQNPWVYSPRTLAPGQWEYEQSITWKTDKQSDSNYDEFRINHEIEWGVTDAL